MPEIKRNFTKGKMNKDLDERLVPDGEYRDAMNIQVSTSEGSDVGTVQNILGNQVVSGQSSILPTSPVCVGIVADESNDILYWFVTGSNKDMILQLKNTSGGGKNITPVLVDLSKTVLKFDSDNIITGINIIDDMLFWCDGTKDGGTEPKKINIPRCIAGTPDATTQTNLINLSQEIDINSDVVLEEKHITVIKKSPPTPPVITLESERDAIGTHTGVMLITKTSDPSNLSSFNLNGSDRFDFSEIYIGSQLNTKVETDIDGNSGFNLSWKAGDTIFLKEFEGDDPPKIPITDYRIKGKILDDPAKNDWRDGVSEEVFNGDFTVPNSTGVRPMGYTFYSNVGFTFNAIEDRIECDEPGANKKIRSDGANINWKIDGDYKVEVELSNVVSGGVNVGIVADYPNATSGVFPIGNPYNWTTSNFTTDGTNTETLTLSTATGSTFSQFNYMRKNFFIQTSSSGFVGNIDSISIEDQSAEDAKVFFEVTSINGIPPKPGDGVSELKYAIDKQDQEEKLFEFKFPRFATRYKYEDGEYSAFSPFSEIAFLPGSFDYHPKKGYNLGMTNRINKIKIENLNTHVPSDVISIDILYKEEDSPNIYVVDTVKFRDWESMYTIDSETINRTLPSNQLLRPWDNVPKKALAQDIVGNRIVYGNYLQGYNLTDIIGGDYSPNINFEFTNDNIINTTKSIKSLREYQLGVVFVDKHGRETPVISNQNTTKKLEKSEGDKTNQIDVNFGNANYVDGMKYFKFFVKETSGEYYNMAMDRFWDAGDNHVWVSFPSSDRNKIDLDTFLILKKGVQTNDLVEDPARYKVIAIENEAPDFIKTKKILIEEKTHVFATENIFNDTLNNIPLSGRDSFKMNYDPFRDSSGAKLHEIKDTLYVEFTKTGETATSNRYRITSIETDHESGDTDSVYSIKLDKILGEDVDFMSDTTKIIDTTIVRIYQYKVENSSEFDGRFFVKLINDDIFIKNITQGISADVNYRVLTSKKLYYLKGDRFGSDSIINTHASSITGQDDGIYDDSIITNNDFGRYACFFRNYDSENTNITKQGTAQNPAGTGNIPINQYIFGDVDEAKFEFAAWTSTQGHWVGQGSQMSINTVKRADVAADDEEVWFIDDGDYKGKRTYNGSLHWPWISTTGGTNYGIHRTGSNNYSTLNIGIGGIYHDTIVNKNSNPNIPGFFDIGVDGGNPFYQDNNTKDLVSKFNPGIRFRFKEDPRVDVYTIQPSVGWKQLLRYNRGGGTGPRPQTMSAMVYDARLSPNFTRNWILKIQNQDETDTHIVKWDPTGALGVIDNGLELTINHSTYTTSPITITSSSQVVVKVDDLSATYNNATHQIKVGMVLHSHSGGTTFDGGTLSDWLVIWKIEEDGDEYNIFLTGYSRLIPYDGVPGNSHNIYSTAKPSSGGAMVFKQPKMNGYSEYSANRINANADNFSIDNPGLKAVGYTIEFIEPIKLENELPDNPAIWETEPKESTDLDIYYEASGLNPIQITEDTKDLVIPIGSTVEHVGNPNSIEEGNVITSTGYEQFTNYLSMQPSPGWFIYISPTTRSPYANKPLVGGQYINGGDLLKIKKPDGSAVTVKVMGWGTVTSNRVDKIYIANNLYNPYTKYTLNWSNCFAFGNGVESNRIRDNFNLPYILNGVKVSTTLEEGDYKEEHRKYGLIYSGLYNAISGINNLNQFIAAEKITKDINPTYGSIQKLHTRDTDLVTLCEDKILKILASKDAVYNADGKPQLVATENVLGQTVPFVGEFGISRNPESFASEAYRAYFTDKVRGSVMRLSKDGLTPISMHGMKDWFRDNLKLGNKYILGSYDDKKDDYNLTIKGDNISKTVSFSEDVRGWVSFKSFVPQHAISMANDYYTISAGKIYEHHREDVDRNTFYNENLVDSSIKLILNDSSEAVKTFNTLNYEGSQSKINKFQEKTIDSVDPTDTSSIISTTYNDGQYYNLANDKPGWHVDNIQTDLQNGSIPEFIKKEGKWFNYIRGKDIDITSLGQIVTSGISHLEEASLLQQQDSAEMSFQGIGILKSSGTSVVWGCTECGTFWETQNPGSYCDGISSATSIGAFNYSSLANNDDGNCEDVVYGCMVAGNPTYNPNANTDTSPTSCIYYGCITPGMWNSNTPSNANTDDGSCIPFIYGCTASGQFNTTTANTACNGPIPSSPGSGCFPPNCTGQPVVDSGNNACCEPTEYGCMDTGANIYNTSLIANTPQDTNCHQNQTISTHPLGCNCISIITPLCASQGGFTFGVDTVNERTYPAFPNNSYPKQLEFKQTNNNIVYDFDFEPKTTTPPYSPLGAETTLSTQSILANNSISSIIVDPNTIQLDGDYKVSWNINYDDGWVNDCSGDLTFNVVLGCMESQADGYDQYLDPPANIDDGSCVPWEDGCMDCGQYWEAQMAIEPNTATGCTDGSGSPIPCLGCYCNDTQKWDGTSCSGDGSSATTLGAFNFDYDATRDDNSCITTLCDTSINLITNCGCGDNTATSGYGFAAPCIYTNGCPSSQSPNQFNNPANNIIVGANNPDPYYWNCTYDGCMDSGTGSTTTIYGNNTDIYGECIDGTTPSCPANTYNCCGADNGYLANNYDPIATASGAVTCIYPGCTSCGTAWETQNPGSFCDGVGPATTAGALNFNPLATPGYDDSSCVNAVYGCMTSTACNFSPTANIDDGNCLTAGCIDPNANNWIGHTSTITACSAPATCTYTLAAPSATIVQTSNTQTAGAYVVDPNTSYPIYNRIAVSWPLISGNVSGYTVKYRLAWSTSAWTSVDVPATPVATIGTGDYLYILDPTTVTNTWPTGQDNPDTYDVFVSQKEEYAGTNISATTGLWVGGTTIPGTSGTTNSVQNSSTLNHVNFITPVDDTTIPLNFAYATPVYNGLNPSNGKQKWGITYTWDKLPTPTTNNVVFGIRTDNASTYGLQATNYHVYQRFTQDPGEPINTEIYNIEVDNPPINTTGTHDITTRLKLGYFMIPTAGTGCHKPPYNLTATPPVLQTGNNPTDLFHCQPGIVGEAITATINTVHRTT